MDFPKIELTTDEKIMLGCTGVVMVAAGAVLISNHCVNSKLKKTMKAVAATSAALSKMEDTIDKSNYLLEQDQIDTKEAAGKVLEGLQNLQAHPGSNDPVEKEGEE